MTNDLAALSKAATQGEWIADGSILLGPDHKTIACLENFNKWGDRLDEPSHKHETAFIVALVNEYRAGDLVPNAQLIEAAEARVKVLEEALRAVLPYTEAERLAEASAVRLGAHRDPINKAVLRARQALGGEHER